MWERNIDWLLLVRALTGDQTHNPGMCPDRDRTGDLLLCVVMPNQLSCTSQGYAFLLLNNLESHVYVVLEAHDRKGASYGSCVFILDMALFFAFIKYLL